MDYELWGKFLLAGATFKYTDIPFAMFRQHEQQKTHDMLRQTRSLIDTASKLVLQADFPDATKRELLADLTNYLSEYEKNQWLESGRLARLGVPRPLVLQLRRVRAFVQKTRWIGADGKTSSRD